MVHPIDTSSNHDQLSNLVVFPRGHLLQARGLAG